MAALGDPRLAQRRAHPLGLSRAAARATLLLCLTAFPACADPTAPPDQLTDPAGIAVLQDWGVYDANQVGSKPSPEALSGQTGIIDGLGLIDRNDHPCVRLGTSIGLRYRLSGLGAKPVVVLTKRIDYPLLHAPNGRTGTGEQYKEWALPGEEGILIWSFDSSYELQPGDFTISVAIEGHLALRKNFHVSTECTPVS